MLNCQKQDLESQLTDQVHAITQLNDEVSVHQSKLKEVEESLTDRVKLSNELYHSLQVCLVVVVTMKPHLFYVGGTGDKQSFECSSGEVQVRAT